MYYNYYVFTEHQLLLSFLFRVQSLFSWRPGNLKNPQSAYFSFNSIIENPKMKVIMMCFLILSLPPFLTSLFFLFADWPFWSHLKLMAKCYVRRKIIVDSNVDQMQKWQPKILNFYFNLSLFSLIWFKPC